MSGCDRCQALKECHYILFSLCKYHFARGGYAMPLFTVLNHGTGSHRRRTDGEIIADFGRNMRGVEYKDFLITDGVGKAGTRENPLPGNFDPFTKDKQSKGDSPAWSRTPTKTLRDITGNAQNFFSPTGHGFLRGAAKVAKVVVPEKAKAGERAITGEGWDDNIRHSIAVLADVWASDMTGTLNMIGWSRGAVTCLRMANWIKEFLGNGININIFAIDPVAGLDAGERLKDTYVIPDIVKQYVGILMLDEMRGDFKPQDLSRIEIADRNQTKVAFLPFPGVHNTPVMLRDSQLGEVTRLVRVIAYKFLTLHGTLFLAPEVEFTSAQMCEIYADAVLKRAGYKAMTKTTGMAGMKAKLMGGLEDRTTRVQAASYVSADAAFFLNEHHRMCFEASARDVYNYFFTRGVANAAGKTTTAYRASDPWGQKFQQFSQSLPKSFQALSSIYLLERQGGIGSPAVWRASAPGCGATNPALMPGAGTVLQPLV